MSPGVRDLGQDLTDLGLALGILVPGAGGPELNAAWFEDPAARLTGVLRNPGQRQAALDLARRALGEADVDDVDLRELAAGESWLPLATSSTVTAGLYAVVREEDDDVWLGLGARVAAHDTPGGVVLDSSATVLVPLVRFPALGPAELLLGSPAGVVRIGAAVDAPGGLAGGDVELRGAAVDADVPTGGSAPPTLSVALKGLRLPGEPARDLVISDPSQLDRTAAEITAGLLAARAGAATGTLAHFLALTGVRPDPAGAIPPLPVADLAADGLPALYAWTRALVADPGAVRAWLGELAALAGATAPAVGGDGTEGSPYEVELPADPRVTLILRVTRDPGTGLTVLRPGVRVEAAGGLGRAIGEVELAAVRLSSPPSGLALPKLLALVALEGAPLADATVRGLHVVVGSLRAGVALDERRAPIPVLEARDISIDGTPHEVIDLTSAESVAGAVADVAGAVATALTSLPEGRALAALCGLVRPDGVAAGDPWPPLIDPAGLLVDPVRAVADYHATVLDQPGAWAHLTRELAVLVRAAGLPAAVITGAGTATSPWAVRLAEDVRGSVDLLAWSEPGPRLFLGVRAALAPVAVGGKQLVLEARSELVSIELPAGGAAWAPVHSLAARLAEELVLDPGPVALLARSLVAAITWNAGEGVRPAVQIEQPRLRLDGTEVALPEVDWDGTGSPFDPAGLPWEALESLAGQALDGRGGPLARLALLAGWAPGTGPIAVRPPALPELELSLDPELLPRLSLQLLVGDPAGALRLWAGELLRSEQALPALAWVSDGTLSGSGAPADPWALRPLAGAPELLVWLEPDGPSLAAIPELLDHLLPDTVDGTDAAELLARAGALVPELRDLLSARPLLSAQLHALRVRLEQGDGIVPTVAAVPAGGPWTSGEIAAGHLDLPAAFDADAHMPAGAPPAPRHVYLCAPLPGVRPWRGQAAEIDLTAPELPPEGFDHSRIPSAGPWYVLLPTRDAAGGFSGVVARTRLALAAIRAASGGAVCLIAHSTAGFVARVLAAEEGISHLVTVGTPHAGADFDALVPGDLAEALRAVLAVRDLIGDPDVPLAGVLRGLEVAADGWLPAADGRARREPWPGDDFVPPPFGPLHPDVTAARAVAGHTDPAAFAGFLRAALEAAGSQLTGFDPAARPPAAIGLGLRHVEGPAELRIDLHPAPHLRARATVQRDGGWLAGDAGQGPGPRVRWAELELDASPHPPEVEARMLLHEASALGVRARRWRIDGDSLAPEARVLLGELATGLGPLPATGPLAALGDLLAAIGVVELAADRTVSVVPGALERLLIDPQRALSESLREAGSALPAALAELLGAPAPAADGSIELSLTGGSALTLAPKPAAHAALRASVGPARAELTLDADGRVSGRASVASLHTTLDSAQPEPVEITLDGVALMPIPDTATLARRGGLLLLGELLRVALEWARAREPALDPVLDALALRRSPVANPAPLLQDPGAWLARPDVAGTPAALIRLLEAGRGLLAPTAPAGGLPLPWGLRATAAADGDDALLTAAWESPAGGTNMDLDGRLVLRIAPGPVVLPELAVTVRLRNLDTIDSLALDVGFDGRHPSARLRFRLAAGEPEVVIPLLPTTGGLGALGAVAPSATLVAVLPLVLDAVGGSPAPLGPAVRNAGDALALRTDSQFDAAALRSFAAAPWAHVRSHATAALPRAADLAATVLPAARVTAGRRPVTDVPFLALRPVDNLSVELDVPSTGPLRFCARVTGAAPVAGLALDAHACVTDAGIDVVEFAAEVTDPDLLKLGSVSFFPLARVTRTGAEAGVWLAPPPAAGRRALVAKLGFAGGGVELACRPDAGPDSTDLGPCAAAAVRAYLVPLVADLLLSAAPVVARLNQPLHGATAALGDVLVGAGILDRSAAGDFELAPDALDPTRLSAHVFALAARLADALTAPLSPADLPVGIQLISEDADAGRTRYGVRLTLPEPLELSATGGVRFQLETSMLRFASGDAGIELLAVSLPTGGTDPLQAQVDPVLRIRGLGLRALSESGGHLVDLVASVDALAIHGVYERDAAGVSRAGGRILLVNLGVPLGRAAGGGNPVAAKVLSGGAEQLPAGDQTELRPAISPQLVILRAGEAPARVSFSAGEGDGPWWLPIQQRFGPLYVEQVGVGTEPVDRARFLMDGGVSLAGLRVGVDDLSLSLPWRRPLRLEEWRIDLAGLAIGFDGGAVALAGGLRKRPGDPPAPPDYVGMLQVKAGQFQLAAVGGYAELPESPGASRTYTSLLAFAALSFPIGGPPPFFITGLGGGLGLNRRLVLPVDVNEVPRFSLVAAMDPASPFAADPMSAVQRLGQDFPPSRGTFWGAAGVRFRSFALVESIAVLSAEMGDGVEVNLLGLSRMDIPPDHPLARIELALRARFSTREMVLAIQAQLTDNSWLLDSSCRLTGGFAFVIWFREGQFVLTLGGYHPRFTKPAKFPDVPRLGFNWSVSDVLAIKGESYFALTATCVMAGGRLEAAFDAGWVWASFAFGMDALVSWDPFHYDVSGFVRVSAGVSITIWTPFGDAHVRLSLSIGAEVHVWGPELRGEATLDLDVTSVTVRFGSSGPESGRDPIGWTLFHNRYLVAGDPDGLTMSAAVTAGLLIPDPGAGRRAPGSGKPGEPWRVTPEFGLRTDTKAASNVVAFGDVAEESSLDSVTTEHIDLGPMHETNVTSRHHVTLTEDAAAGTDRTGRLRRETVTTNVPQGIWRFDLDGPAPAAEVRPAFTGALLVAESHVPAAETEVSLLQVEITRHPLPLPFGDEIADRSEFETDSERADAYAAAQPVRAGAILGRAAQLMGVNARRLAAERVAPPRLAPLTEGMVDTVKPPVAVEPAPEPEPPRPPDPRVLSPRLRALLRDGPAPTARGPAPTSVGEEAAATPRAAPPSLSRIVTTRGASLRLSAPQAQAIADTLAAPDGGPPTRAAGTWLEQRPGLRASEAVAGSLGELEAALARGETVPLTPGDVQVWDLPNAAFDAGNPRPGLSVKGDQLARALALDRGGHVLAEASGKGFELELPAGAGRIAVVGEGRADGEGGEPAATGWHAGTRLRQLSINAFVGLGAVVTTSAPATLRGRRPVSAALVTAAEAVAGRATVTTRLPASTRTLLVALEPTPDVDAELEGIALGLEGAARDGSDPHTVVAGPRTYRVFGLEPDPEASGVLATVASDERWALAAVIGCAASPEVMTGELLTRGLEELLDSGTRSPLGSSVVAWHAKEEMSA